MIDDFGTGYSSLGRLRELEIDKIKIDKSFLAYADVNQKSAKIFESIFALAATLEIDVVAEGLETMAQLEVLRSFPPMLTQGYLLQKPVKKELLAEEADFYPIINGH
jgi:EAL domain-containing protein (putative c-di-GMP-specific phosphodiesterase class I)